MKVLRIMLPLSIILPVTFQVDAQHSERHGVDINGKKNEWVTVKRSQYGMAHIEADSLYGLAYGNAYAQAQDHSCILADGYLRVQGQRAEYLGAHNQPGDNRHVLSDFGYKILDIRGRTEQAYASLSSNTKQLAEGFAAGYNAFLSAADKGKEVLGSECQNASWVKPIEAIDVVAGILDLGVQNSSVRMIPAYVKAHPLEGDEWRPTLVKPTELTAWNINNYGPLDLESPLQTQGSNGWALGKNKTENGRGIVLANPHFPFNGNFRFWANHAKVKGELDVMGASIIGFPGPVNVGFNQNLAWTHTYSSASHAVVYRLSLKPGDRLSYELDGQWQPIKQQDVVINVQTEAGIQKLSKTLFYTDVGIIVEDERRFPWDDEFVYVIKDTNLDSFDAIDHWLAMNKASNMQAFKKTFSTFDGMLFNNTLVADNHGETFYVDDSNVPLLSDKAINFLKTDPMSSQVFASTGIALLPGNKSEFIFQDEIAFADAPQLQHSDYVQNSNNSYWLTNPQQPLAENSPLYGKFSTEQSLRTRHSIHMLSERAGEDKKFNVHEVERALFDNSTFAAHFKSDIAQLCTAFSAQDLAESTVKQSSVDAVCRAVSLWDGKFNSTSKAAHLINEFVYLLDFERDFNVKFDAANPVATPRELAVSADMLKRLVIAADIVHEAGYSLTAMWGEVQYLQKGTKRISWPGPTHNVGGFNIYAPGNRMDITTFAKPVKAAVLNPLTEKETWSGLNKEGVEVHFGSSWMMVVGFDDNGPQARGLLTFSQSTLESSPHFADQSVFYGKQQKLVDLPYTKEALAKQLKSKIKLKVKKD
ncbi:acyl-homoserine-lactone acylase [Pseudoalteromonas citrea]|uniref:Acyl-homoserine-lactone acylase n=2 Tax=Pseudoalteromonas citrea TaxID=43655 RepID=A0AAD4FQQ4_9GAMM|nr:penicillin acylase family protein [Pseudoalteromonas citrea]KAF7767627.1 acyl-homoserine-lactone acylase [Pseudoalteromonas citrea]